MEAGDGADMAPVMLGMRVAIAALTITEEGGV